MINLQLTGDITIIVDAIGQGALLETDGPGLIIVRRRTVAFVALDTFARLRKGMVSIAGAAVEVGPFSPEAPVIRIALFKVVARLSRIL